MSRKIIIEKPGLLTTVQDLGRYGFQKYGMPVAGAMDSYALRVANIIIGNKEDEGALEVSFPGLSLVFEGEGLGAITGADLGARLNDIELDSWQSFEFKTGDRLSFTSLKKGCRAYLGLQGGMDVPIIMGSKSTYLRGAIGGFQGRKLKQGDQLTLGTSVIKKCPGAIVVPQEYRNEYNSRDIRVVLGPQDGCFSQEEIEKFLSSLYMITNQYDRMAYRLEGPAIKHLKGPDIISDGIAPGAIQIPGHGQPIMMLADRQTVGGYTKIANVISVDLSLLGQLSPGEKIQFSAITIEEAQELYNQNQQRLNKLKEKLLS